MIKAILLFVGITILILVLLPILVEIYIDWWVFVEEKSLERKKGKLSKELMTELEEVKKQFEEVQKQFEEWEKGKENK